MKRSGYTVVELMVTILIAAILSVTVGAFLVKLLTIQERDREEAYIREKLVEVCAVYADFLSVGSYISTSPDSGNRAFIGIYRQETGGVSLETGIVSRATYLTSSMNTTNEVIDLDIYAREPGGLYDRRFSRALNGSAPLIPLIGDMVSCTIRPLNFNPENNKTDSLGFIKTDAVLGYLEITAKYEIENDEGELETRTATAGRVVRLWNRE